jgi:hypothetical protein
MAEGGSSTAEKIMAFAGLGLQLVIIGLLIWLVYKAYECATDNSKCSKTVYSIIRTGTKYDKYTDYITSVQGELIDDSDVKSANTCAKWCTKTYGCNGFVWRDDKCYQTPGDDTKNLLLIPDSTGATYINKDADHPIAGFRYITPVGKDFSSNVEQRLGDIITATTIPDCALKCIEKLESNCIGYSYLTTAKTCQLVSNIANTVITSDMMSYTWTTLSSTDYKDAKF